MARDSFDDILLGGGGPAYFSFGKEAVPGSYIEGVVVEKKHRHKRKYQTQQQRDAGLPPEYEYFVGKAKATSTLPFEEYVKQFSNAKPVHELLLVLQTSLKDPAKETDDGLRTFAFPWRAQQGLAATVRAQGMKDGLPVGSFIRVTLSALVPVPGVSEPRREYEVQVWGPGEQPSPSPAQPQVAVAQAQPIQPTVVPQPQPTIANGFQQPVSVGASAAGGVSLGFLRGQGMSPPPNHTWEILELMQKQGMAPPEGYIW